jgi:hypothetical protein
MACAKKRIGYFSTSMVVTGSVLPMNLRSITKVSPLGCAAGGGNVWERQS